MPTNNLTSKFAELKAVLLERHFERYDEVEIATTAVLSGFHVALIGAPGTGKSMLTRDIAQAFEAEYWEHLMTKFTSPDEIFGPVSIKALKEGRYERETNYTLVTAKIAFMDEVFKANSAILNSTLGVMNERKYKHGALVLDVPLISMFGASNELPEGEELGALFDRFQFRKKVEYIQDPSKFMRMLVAPETVQIPKITLQELNDAQEQVLDVQVTDSTLDSIWAIRSDLQQEGIYVSDRRYRQSMRALKAVAWQAERDAILDDDFRILQHMFWTQPTEVKKVSRIILTHTNPLDLEVTEIMEHMDQIAGEFSAALMNRKQKGTGKDSLTQKGIEWFTKCRTMGNDLAKLQKKATTAGRPTTMVEQAKDRLGRLTRQIGTETMGLEMVEKESK